MGFTKEYILSKELIKILSLHDGEFEIHESVHENSLFIRFVCDNFTVTSRFIDERFPNYKSVIPNNYTNSFVVPKKDLLSAIAAVKHHTNKGTKAVEITIAEGSLKVYAECLDRDVSKTILIPCSGGEDGYTMGLNVLKLETVIKNLDKSCTDVTIQYSEPNRGVIINGMFYLMPIFIDKV